MHLSWVADIPVTEILLIHVWSDVKVGFVTNEYIIHPSSSTKSPRKFFRIQSQHRGKY